MPARPVEIKSRPGIKRDDTLLQGNNYVDGQWMRFSGGLPRKMWGYKTLTSELANKVYGIHGYWKDNLAYMHMGSRAKLQRITTDLFGNTSVMVDRTPVGLGNDPDNVWTFDVLYDTVTATNRLIAHVAPSLSCICSSGAGAIYTGDLTGTAALSAVSLPVGESISGGIVVLHPYLIAYGSDGTVVWSAPNKPTDLTGTGSGTAHVASQKIVYGAPFRGGPANSPAGLLWSSDALVRMSYTGGNTVWSFDTLSTDTTILSGRCVVAYDGMFFWVGNGRFYVFNGVVNDLPNPLNGDWFFTHLNQQQRQKVFAFANPRWGEIWWCFPFGDAEDCTHAIIYNVREKTWYDTELPNGGRTSGVFVPSFRYPVLTGNQITSASTYKMWMHEYGRNEYDGNSQAPLRSWFETAEITMLNAAQGASSKALRVALMEPDFQQSGDLLMTVKGRANARAPEIVSAPHTIPAVATGPDDEVVYLKDTRRLMRFRFESNEIDGDYWLGQTFVHIEEADGRVTS